LDVPEGFIGVSTIEDIGNISLNTSANYFLTNDIDMGDIEHIAIEDFSGIFEGNGFTISNIYINKTGVNEIGFFSTLSGIINNLTVTGIVYGEQRVGLLVGEVNGGFINNCHSDGETYGRIAMGGLIGKMNSGSVLTNSSSTGHVQPYIDSGSNYRIGGLIGEADNVIIRYCFSNASTHNMGDGGYHHHEHGALIGAVTSTGAVMEQTYATGEITFDGGDTNIKTLIGKVASSIEMTNPFTLYGNYESVNLSVIEGGLTYALHNETEFKQQVTFTEFDFDNIWGITENESYPYLLSNYEELEEPEDSGEFQIMYLIPLIAIIGVVMLLIRSSRGEM